MNIPAPLTKLLVNLGSSKITKPATFVKYAGATTIACSSVGFAMAIAQNKDTPAKEKRFLIPQELLDGLVNVTLFLLLTSKAQTLGEKFLKKKYGNIAKENGIDIKVAAESFGMITSIVGSVISQSIATPLVRNAIASKIQKNRQNKADTQDRATKIDKKA